MSAGRTGEPYRYKIRHFATTRWGLSDGRYSVNLFVRNLTDKRAFSNSQLEGGGRGSDLEVRLITPRTVGLSLAVDF